MYQYAGTIIADVLQVFFYSLRCVLSSCLCVAFPFRATPRIKPSAIATGGTFNLVRPTHLFVVAIDSSSP